MRSDIVMFKQVMQNSGDYRQFRVPVQRRGQVQVMQRDMMQLDLALLGSVGPVAYLSADMVPHTAWYELWGSSPAGTGRV